MDRRRFIVAMLAAATALSGCAAKDTAPAATGSPQSGEPAVSGDATVFAAASLTESFKEIGDSFQKEHPGARITFNFAGSSALATQIIEGGGIADVLASADEASMQKVADASLVAGAPATLARNRLEIAVGPGNPKKIAGLADLAKPGLKVVLAAPQVPVGRYGAQALQKAGVAVQPVSLETDVKAVLTKVALGEADAGIVYQTDVKASAGKVEGVEIPDTQNVIGSYPIALINNSKNPAVGRAFMDLALSEKGRKVLLDHGFLAP